MTKLQPLRGFRDLYPKEKGVQRFIFETLQKVADDLGYESYDGPVVEPLDLYLNKTSEELLNRQTFQIKDKKDQILVLRPEMTPTLARMIAAKSGELTFPLKLFNFGVRFRYEAPQKGRSREFNQADFDILGGDNLLADAEILKTLVELFLSLGATKKDFQIWISSRSLLNTILKREGVPERIIPLFLKILDDVDKISDKEFIERLNKSGLTKEEYFRIISSEVRPGDSDYFDNLLKHLEKIGIREFIDLDLSVVRGLDYYTDLVFEVKDLGEIKRSLGGGGRYTNLISEYNSRVKISGVGFAVSDIMLEEFLKEKNIVPTINMKKSLALVTLFPKMLNESIQVLRTLREKKIPSEMYLEENKKLEKQLKYADKTGIPFVVIVGPEEKEKNVVKLKDMKKRTEETLPLEKVVKKLS